MRNVGFRIYLILVVSWFLHLPARFPALGVVRLDFVLIAVLSVLAFLQREKNAYAVSKTEKLLLALVAYSVVTIPFVEWPGSVVHNGLPNFIRVAVFYFFTVSFVKTDRDLKAFLFVFLACQSWRVLEPLYLHVTEGYWGSAAYMAGGEFLDRLSGAPHDIVNPNGLAAIICTILPFLYYMAGLSWKQKLVFVLLGPLFLYSLALTGSRSGVVGLMAVFVGIVVKSKRRALLSLAGGLAFLVAFLGLGQDMKDRYLSIFGEGEKNRATFEGRVEGVKDDFRVMLRRPIFGHGLGTSLEANANFRGTAQPSHDLYTEVGQELGIAGLVIFLLFAGSITTNFVRTSKLYPVQEMTLFSRKVVDAMQIWMLMNIIYSFASYGLSNYEWYLFGGLSVVMRRLAESSAGGEAEQRAV